MRHANCTIKTVISIILKCNHVLIAIRLRPKLRERSNEKNRRSNVICETDIPFSTSVALNDLLFAILLQLSSD